VEIPGRRALFVVCDGMGGHAHGEIASRVVCDTFTAYWQSHVNIADTAEKVGEAANVASHEIDEKSGTSEMGTTMVMVSIEDGRALVAHAGDSRCYVIDIKGNVKYRTIDHVERGLITNAFFTGNAQSIQPEVKTVTLEPLDRILLCTDGLYNTIDDETLLHTLQCAKDVEQVAEKYMTLCQDKASDNYSAIIIEIE
jgi:protein phosphatase